MVSMQDFLQTKGELGKLAKLELFCWHSAGRDSHSERPGCVVRWGPKW